MINPYLMAAALRVKFANELGVKTFVREYGAPQPSDKDMPYISVQYMNTNYLSEVKDKQLITERVFFTIEVATKGYLELGTLSAKVKYLLFYGTFDVYDLDMNVISSFSIENFDSAESPLDYNDYEHTSERNRAYFDVATTVMNVKQTKGGNE